MSNYVTKSGLKNGADIDTLKLNKKVDLATLKLEIDKSDSCKLETTPVDLKNLSDIVDREVIKREVHDKLDKKVNAIQTHDNSDLFKKSPDYNTKNGEF